MGAIGRDSDLSRLCPPIADIDSFRAMVKRRERVALKECFQGAMAVEVRS